MLQDICDSNGISEDQLLHRADEVSTIEMFLMNFPRVRTGCCCPLDADAQLHTKAVCCSPGERGRDRVVQRDLQRPRVTHDGPLCARCFQCSVPLLSTSAANRSMHPPLAG